MNDASSSKKTTSLSKSVSMALEDFMTPTGWTKKERELLIG
jgi:hypothetical protein